VEAVVFSAATPEEGCRSSTFVSKPGGSPCRLAGFENQSRMIFTSISAKALLETLEPVATVLDS
jgi:hypothetical protein